MMQIISHRGLWLNANERNTPAAFERAFSEGFGIETDVRDHQGKLVIAHDLPTETSPEFLSFLSDYQRLNSTGTLALNIKSDGLQGLLAVALSAYQIQNYFCFDMAVPDALHYGRHELTTYTRQSEFETVPSFYSDAAGVWIDCFQSEWVTEEIIVTHKAAQKRLCFVSPELHKRSFQSFWFWMRELGLHQDDQIALCTDFPREARKFFHE